MREHQDRIGEVEAARREGKARLGTVDLELRPGKVRPAPVDQERVVVGSVDLSFLQSAPVPQHPAATAAEIQQRAGALRRSPRSLEAARNQLRSIAPTP